MRRQILAVMMVTAFFVTQSCVKNIQTPENNNPPIMLQELKVPANFGWGMSKTITCVINSTTTARMEIYLDKECTEEFLAMFTAGASNTIPLSVPVSTTKLYLKYKLAAGADKILEQSLSNNTATFSVSDAAEAKSVLGSKAITKDVPVDNNTPGHMSYPANWGTVMFEDLFPAIGDYDFNDFVASYLIMIEYPWKDGAYDTQHTKQIRVQLRLRAIGGSLAFTPYVRVAGLNKNIVSLPNPPYGDPTYINPKILNNTTDGVEVSLVNSNQTDDVIIEFKNLNSSNPFKIPGVAFYNTTHGNAIKHNQLTEVDVYLAFSEELNVADLLDDKIDIFLASGDKTREIHLRGFYPVFSEYDFKATGVDKNIPYASDKNLVWGIKVPRGINFLHVAEKINFCEAYKDFAPWVTSGGVANQDWYKTNVEGSNLIKWAK